VALALSLCVGCAAQERPDPVAEVRRLDRSAPAPTAAPVDPDRMPPATRQMDEGYWLGALIGPEDATALDRLGVRVVLSAVSPGDEAIAALEAAGIEQVAVPMSDRFRHADTILRVTDTYPPEQIFIHCRHGADRTGAIAAFLLVVRHDWPIGNALHSVVYPNDADLTGLGEVMGRQGVGSGAVRTLDDPTVGFYSLTGAGVGIGGMKARNERYQRLVETVIQAMRQHGDLPLSHRWIYPPDQEFGGGRGGRNENRGGESLLGDEGPRPPRAG